MLSCWGLIQVRESVKKSPWPLQSYQHSWLTWHPWKIDLLPQSIKISPLPWKARKTWFVWPGSGFPDGLDGKESACNAGDPGLISRSRRSPGERNSNPPQYSCLGNSMDRGAWWAIVHGVARVRHDWVTNRQCTNCVACASYLRVSALCLSGGPFSWLKVVYVSLCIPTSPPQRGFQDCSPGISQAC